MPEVMVNNIFSKFIFFLIYNLKNLSSPDHKSFALHLTRTAPAALSIFDAVLGGDAVGDFADVTIRTGAGGHLHCLLFS